MADEILIRLIPKNIFTDPLKEMSDASTADLLYTIRKLQAAHFCGHLALTVEAPNANGQVFLEGSKVWIDENQYIVIS